MFLGYTYKPSLYTHSYYQSMRKLVWLIKGSQIRSVRDSPRSPVSQSGSDCPAGAPDTFVTLNPPTPPAAEHTIKRLTLSHPVFGAGACEAQEALPSIQARSVYYVAPCFRLVSNPQAHANHTYHTSAQGPGGCPST